MTKHIISYSGGIGSYLAARRVIDKYGPDDVILVFTDTMVEDWDLYRFLEETQKDLGVPLIKLCEGRTPWQVFKDYRFIGNSRIDPCSKVLKRDLFRKWMESNYKPEDVVIYLGIDWSEIHRFERTVPRWLPWVIEAPLCTEPPYLTKSQMFDELKARGIKRPRLYDLGFSHNNCAGVCVKAGQTQWKLLLEKLPERYRYHERMENEMRAYLGKNVAILSEAKKGVKTPLTLTMLRERIEAKQKIPEHDWGGCGCFVDFNDSEDFPQEVFTLPLEMPIQDEMPVTPSILELCRED